MPINPIQTLPRVDTILPNRKLDSSDNGTNGGGVTGGSAIADGTGTSPFSQLLDQSIRHITEQQDEANQAVGDFLNGSQEDPHHMMLAVQRADLSFDMFVQVRNKVISAYQEVMRMPE